jgi:ferric iron reductase protein FhuF
MVATHRLRSLLATWSDHIYRHQPAAAGTKPLLSLWAQWYIGLMVPPLMLALLNEPQGLSLAPEHFHVEFHESGRAACFWIDVHARCRHRGFHRRRVWMPW